MCRKETQFSSLTSFLLLFLAESRGNLLTCLHQPLSQTAFYLKFPLKPNRSGVKSNTKDFNCVPSCQLETLWKVKVCICRIYSCIPVYNLMWRHESTLFGHVALWAGYQRQLAETFLVFFRQCPGHFRWSLVSLVNMYFSPNLNLWSLVLEYSALPTRPMLHMEYSHAHKTEHTKKIR